MKKMNILIIGSGGREHALGWKINQSPFVGEVYFAPGNGGTAELGTNVSIAAIDINNLVKFAKQNNIDFTVVGPDDPLALGIVDVFKKHHLKIFGPTQKAARLEWDKSWALRFMDKYKIPHPLSRTFRSVEKAKQYIEKKGANNIVIKANGLAAGKGVILPDSLADAYETVENILVKKQFGKAGRSVVIQERLVGTEISVTALSDGKTIIPLLTAQDHKRVFANDEGSNTGGMGAYAPVPFVNKEMLDMILQKILLPVVKGMQKEGIPYVGILYPGLMLTNEGPKVLEFNCRFGDPETQPLMVLLKDDLVDLMSACVDGMLANRNIGFKDGFAVCVILASKGYPGAFNKGEVVKGLHTINASNTQVFHAGTVLKDGNIVTAGGRVLGITGYGESFTKARINVYNSVKAVTFSGMHFRKDIGMKAINK